MESMWRPLLRKWDLKEARAQNPKLDTIGKSRNLATQACPS